MNSEINACKNKHCIVNSAHGHRTVEYRFDVNEAKKFLLSRD